MGLDKSPQNHKESQCLEWSLLTRQKSTTLKRSSGGKTCQEVRGVSLHFFGSSPLIWQKSHAASPILSGEVNALRHHLVMFLQFAKIPATENSEIGTDSSYSFEKLGKKLDLPPPTPSPPIHSRDPRDLPGKNEIPTSPRFSASTQHLVGGGAHWSLGFGV